MDDFYFEPQRDKDCVIHSLNNAIGERVITRGEVLAHIEAQKRKIAIEKGEAEAEKYARTSSTNSTFFVAEVVWDAARHLGRIAPPTPIPGFGGDFARVSSLPGWLRNRCGIVLLGIEPHGKKHAIAARDGVLLDSHYHRHGPVEFNDSELKKKMANVFAAYVMAKPGGQPVRIVRTQPMSIKWGGGR